MAKKSSRRSRAVPVPDTQPSQPAPTSRLHIPPTEKPNPLFRVRLDGWLAVVERLTVLAVLGFTFLSVLVVLFGAGENEFRSRLISFWRALDTHWRIGLIILFVLFYRTVRTFLEEVEEAYGMRRRRPGKQGTEEPYKSNT